MLAVALAIGPARTVWALEADIDAGITVHDFPRNRVEAKTVVANLQGGIFVENGADATIVVRNTVKENYGNGIQVVESKGNTIGANVVEDNTLIGVLLDIAERNRVIGNTVSWNGGNGIYLKNANENQVIANNTVTSNVGKGIQLWMSDDNTVTGGFISGNGSGSGAEQVLCDPNSDDNIGNNQVNGVPGVGLPAECL